MVTVGYNTCADFFSKVRTVLVDSGKRSTRSDIEVPPGVVIINAQSPILSVFEGKGCSKDKLLYEVEPGVGQIIDLPFIGNLSLRLTGDKKAKATIGE